MSIHICHVYKDFVLWLTKKMPDSQIPSNREFIKNLRKHLDVKKIWIGKLRSLGLNNIKLKLPE